MKGIVEITDANFRKEVLESDRPAMVDFWAEWCMPCKILEPVVEELAGELDGRVKVGKLNVDDSTRVPTDLGVMNIPTIVFFRDGREITRTVGIVRKGDILKKIKEFFGEF